MTGTTSGPGSGAEFSDSAANALLPVPEHQRTSKVSHQFWIWAGANIAPINWVLGALGIKLGLSLSDVVLALVLGNTIGMVLFGFFVLMGQSTGVTQMVLARSAFGLRGANLPAIIQGVISAGWCAINTWIVLDLCLALLRHVGIEGGFGMKIAIVLGVMLLQTVLAARGFKSIATFEKYTVPVTILVLIAMTIAAFTSLPVNWQHTGNLEGIARLSALSTVMTAIGIGWGITWFAYAADYSRFVPKSESKVKLYASSVLGQFIPVVWLGVLGACLATISHTVDPGQLIVDSYGTLAIPVLLLVLHGPVATNILNIYSCTLCAQTIGWKAARSTIAILVGVVATAFTIYLVREGDFAHSLDMWLAGLVTWVAPWASIMLMHYYVIKKQKIDVDALFDDPATSTRLPSVNWAAITAFLIGIVATWSCEYGVPNFLKGPIATAMGGIDLSWLAGLLVAGPLYYVLETRRTASSVPANPVGGRNA